MDQEIRKVAEQLLTSVASLRARLLIDNPNPSTWDDALCLNMGNSEAVINRARQVLYPETVTED